MAGVVKFLNSKKPQRPPARMGVIDENWRPTKAEAAKFARYYAAAMSPASVLADLEGGALTPEAAETLRALYPKLFEQVADEYTLAIAESKEQIPRDRLVQMSILLGRPLDPSMSAGHIRRQQAMFDTQKQQQQQQPKATGANLDKLSLGSRMMAPDEAREKRRAER
jgi:hypothetical protein